LHHDTQLVLYCHWKEPHKAYAQRHTAGWLPRHNVPHERSHLVATHFKHAIYIPSLRSYRTCMYITMAALASLADGAQRHTWGLPVSRHNKTAPLLCAPRLLFSATTIAIELYTIEHPLFTSSRPVLLCSEAGRETPQCPARTAPNGTVPSHCRHPLHLARKRGTHAQVLTSAPSSRRTCTSRYPTPCPAPAIPCLAPDRHTSTHRHAYPRADYSLEKRQPTDNSVRVAHATCGLSMPGSPPKLCYSVQRKRRREGASPRTHSMSVPSTHYIHPLPPPRKSCPL
jgi:hypothetical protein